MNTFVEFFVVAAFLISIVACGEYDSSLDDAFVNEVKSLIKTSGCRNGVTAEEYESWLNCYVSKATYKFPENFATCRHLFDPNAQGQDDLERGCRSIGSPNTDEIIRCLVNEKLKLNRDMKNFLEVQLSTLRSCSS